LPSLPRLNRGPKRTSTGENTLVKIALLVLLGLVLGALGGAALFGVIAVRDAEIAIEREPQRRHDT
jgi:hypothetical protein